MYSHRFHCDRCNQRIDETQYNAGQGLCVDCEVELMELEDRAMYGELPEQFESASPEDVDDTNGF